MNTHTLKKLHDLVAPTEQDAAKDNISEVRSRAVALIEAIDFLLTSDTLGHATGMGEEDIPLTYKTILAHYARAYLRLTEFPMLDMENHINTIGIALADLPEEVAS